MSFNGFPISSKHIPYGKHLLGCRKNRRMTMKTTDRLARGLAFHFCVLSVGLVLGGCASYEVAGNMEQGRPQLIWGDPKVALAHFQRAAELDPNYRYDFSLLSEGVWSYVGRAYYEAGNIPEAKKALERDLSQYNDDNLSRLYLGMVQVKEGDSATGLKTLQTALQSLNDWLENVIEYSGESGLWDPGMALRSEIHVQLAMISTISTKEAQLPELVSRAEDLGKRFENEIDLVRRDKDRYSQGKDQ
jgi:tetratricopeptide (TPR) repeat protein